MPGSVIVAGARTPIGKLGGTLAGLTAMELGGVAIAAALSRAGVAPGAVDRVLMGHVLQAGQGQITARQAAVSAGIPMTVPATTVNKVCLSGLHTLYLADLMIGAGDAEVVVAGGMESMSRAPYLLAGAREGYRLGDAAVVDSMMHDGLYCSFDGASMGAATEAYTAAGGTIDRRAQDKYAARSHQRASDAAGAGHLAEETAPVLVQHRTGETVVDLDEGVRPGTDADALARLRPAFGAGGTITAGNSSQISDGGAALVVTSRARAESLGVRTLGEVVGYGQVAGPGPSLLTQPSRAARLALDRSGVALSDVDLFEINEAFAAVALASMADLGISDDNVNVNGGAIALGHPIGMSGTRLGLTLLHELARRRASTGVAALCGGGGQGDAVVVRRT